MIDQRERRRLMEEAASAHAAKVRRRLLIGVPLTLVLVAAAAVAYAALGGSPLAKAADRAGEHSARVRIDISGGDVLSISGELATTGDGSKAIGRATVTYDGETMPSDIRIVGGRVWIGDGVRWRSLDPDEAPWAPRYLVDRLADTQRVRPMGREQAAGQRTTHYRARLPLSKLMRRDVDGWLPIDVWIDEAGRPVLIRSVTTYLRLELEVLEWDVPVDVEPPRTS